MKLTCLVLGCALAACASAAPSNDGVSGRGGSGPSAVAASSSSVAGSMTVASVGSSVGASSGTSSGVSSASTAASAGSGGALGRDWQAYPPVYTAMNVAEIDAMGDIHGDVDTMNTVLGAAGLVDANHAWSGGARTLIITGDVIDKGDYSLPVLDELIALTSEAEQAGGRVVVTLGNHEAEFLADPENTKATPFRAELMAAGLDPVAVAQGGSKYGVFLRTRPIAALVDEWFFAHGGNADGWSAQNIGAEYMQLFDAESFGDPFLIGPSSLLEAQVWWATGASSTAVLDTDLGALPAAHVVFGHDPGSVSFPDDPAGDRSKGQMVTRYAGRIFMIDVGMSYAVAYSTGSLLRIVRGATTTATQVHADGTTTLLWQG